MVKTDGFFLISDFHQDLNYLHDPNYFSGDVLHWSPEKQAKNAGRIKTIYDWSPYPRDTVVAFVGDTTNSPEASMLVLTEAAAHFEHVLFLPGNHEYYHPKSRTVAQVEGDLRRYISTMPNVSLLEPHVNQVMIGNVLFIGCCGWYDWNACDTYDFEAERGFWLRYSSDSRMIQFDYGHPDDLARIHASWLINQVELAQNDDQVEKIVLLTHTIPRIEFCVPRDHQWYPLNGSYLNSWMERVPLKDEKKKIKVWGFGHTHFHFDQYVDHIRYVNNARGYHNERPGDSKWEPKWIDLNETPVDKLQMYSEMFDSSLTEGEPPYTGKDSPSKEG